MTGPPSSPGQLRVTGIVRDAVTVAWDPPASDGGLPVTGYVIERRNVSHGGWTTAGTADARTRHFKVAHLIEGNEYYLRVMAENEAGTSVPAETASPVEVKNPYGELTDRRHRLHSPEGKLTVGPNKNVTLQKKWKSLFLVFLRTCS